MEAGFSLYYRNGDVSFAELRFNGNCQVVGRSFLSVYVSQRRLADSITVWLVELVILGLLLANRSMRNTLRLQQKAAALQKENNTARYTALQNQLNPHFLFNSLNTLISEIRYNPANAELFTQHLSDVYRYILQCQNQRLTTLREELDFLNSYIFLHRVRLGDCIHIDNRIPKTCMEAQLPPLTIQLLAENVIKHNVIHTGNR